MPLSEGLSEILVQCQTISESEKRLEALLSRNGIADTIRDLFSQKVWGDYDPSMATHLRRIEILLWQLADLDRSMPIDGMRIFKNNCSIADIGGGSGSVARTIIDMFRPDSEAYSFSIVDLSEDMMETARRRLTDADARFISHDILAQGRPYIPLADNSQDIVLMSQVLPFLFDRAAAMEESKQGRMYLGHPHMVKRLGIIEEQVRILKDGGHLVIIDEDPMLYTMSCQSPEQILRSRIFSASTRMVQLNDLLNGVMKNASEKVRFLCQFDIPIDGHHRMYLMAYRKERAIGSALPHELGPEELEILRDAAVGRLLETMKAISWWPMVDEEPRIAVKGHNIRDGRVLDMRRGQGHLSGGGYDAVVLAEQLFRHDNGQRLGMIASAIESLREGGSLIIAEDFDKLPGGQYPQMVRNSYFRQTIMPRFGDSLSFIGSISTPVHPDFSNAMIGYHYMRFSK